jgi:hypothetical protein
LPALTPFGRIMRRGPASGWRSGAVSIGCGPFRSRLSH